jgi:hypothetical protein
MQIPEDLKTPGDKMTLYVRPPNHNLMPTPEASGQSRHWILEIHFIGLAGFTKNCRPRLAKCKCEGLHTRIKKFDLEGAVFNLALLADQLVKAIFLDSAVSSAVDIGSPVIRWGCAV